MHSEGENIFKKAQAKGEIRVEVRSAGRDEPLDGWPAADCTPFAGDELDAAGQWGDKNVGDLDGQTVRLHFQLPDAALK